MRTAVDTNVLSALWSREPLAAEIARRLGEARTEGGLVISGPVYAELLAYPRATEAFVGTFLSDTGVVLDFDLGAEVWIEAGRRFARYAGRRRQSKGEHPKRLLADFIIGTHAMVKADRLMTLDPNRYQREFPELSIV